MAPFSTLRKLLVASALGCAAVIAQTTDPGIQSLALEATLPLANIGTAGQINIPANVLTSLQGGAVEVRQLANYIPATRLLQIRHYLVQRGAPNPTPAGGQMATLEDYRVFVTQVIRSDSPSSLTMIGTVDSVMTDSPFGQSRGLPFVYSLGYDAPTSTSATGTTTPTRFNTISLLIPGRMATFIANGTGTLTFGSTTTPGSGDLKANAGPDISTVASEITLDASASTAPAGSTLTYQWRVVSGAALVLDPAAVKTRVQLSGNYAVYVIELTVTDSTGKTDTTRVNITYTGRF